MRHHNGMDKKVLNDPNIIDIGFMGVCIHNQPCSVYHSGDKAEPAVLTSPGVFQPSWKAQKEGWKLVEAKTGFQRWLLRHFFNKDK